MGGLRASRLIARLGSVLAVLLAVGLLGVIVASFLDQQRDRIAAVRAQERGVEFARPVALMLDRVARARLAAARFGAGDVGAQYRYLAARRSALDAFAEIEALQRRHGSALETGADVAALRRTVATLLPRRALGGADVQRAFGALADRTVRLLEQVGDGSGLVLDAETETYALVTVTVTQLPALMDASGRALALHHVGGSGIELAMAKATVQESLERLESTLGQGSSVSIDDGLHRALRPSLHELVWDTTSLVNDLTAQAEGRGARHASARGAAAPLRAYALWDHAARHLERRLAARGAALVRRNRLVLGAGGTLLLFALAVFAVHLHDRRRSQALASRLDRREAVLHETQARYRALVENLPAVTYVIESGRVSYVSPKLPSLFGHDPHEWTADPEMWIGAVHPDDQPAARAGRRAAATGPATCEYRLRTPDGDERWVRDEAAPVCDDDGAVRYVQGVLVDITDRRHAEAERDRMELELQVASKLEAVGQLAAGVAHEINTPIQFVGDSVRFLSESVDELLRLVARYRAEIAAAGDSVDAAGIADAEELADLEYLQERVPAAFARTFEGVGRVSTIVSAMKAFSHTAGPDMAPADLNDALQTTLVVCANEYKYVANLETELGELPPVHCSIGDLNQVFLNLVVNAAHAIEDRGGDGRGTITVRTEHSGDDVMVTVEDTGCGIPDDVRERMFEPFFTTKEVGRGSGQGLALARSIVVDRHGGSLDVDTAVGQGTTFSIRVPIGGR